MKIKIFILSLVTALIFSSCDSLNDLLGGISDGSLSTEEVVDGLKTALNVGTDSATSVLSVVNGYYGDELVKIPLPDEIESAEKIVENILTKKSSALSTFLNSAGVNLDIFESLRYGVNKAAESAASEAGPIFGNSIQDLSISNAWDILNGLNPADPNNAKSSAFDSTAATQYFKTTTKLALIDLYAPKIDHFLDQPITLNKSGQSITPNSAFNTVKTNYNYAYDLMAVAASVPFVGVAVKNEMNSLGIKPITTPSIGTFCTDKALDGLFFKVGNEEKKIRRNPFQYVSDIIQKVFGSIFKD